MIIHNVEQKSDEWFKLRELRMTASHAQAIGNCGAGLDSYIYQKLSEYYSTAKKEIYTNEDLERGNELEDEARSIYELNTNTEVEQVGFIEYSESVGCSPDGLINDDGGIEIKCPNDLNYFKLLVDFKIKSDYMWQIQMNLLITGRNWWDYVVYNPNFKKDIIIERIEPNKEMFEKLLKGFDKGEKLIKEIINKLN